MPNVCPVKQETKISLPDLCVKATSILPDAVRPDSGSDLRYVGSSLLLYVHKIGLTDRQPQKLCFREGVGDIIRVEVAA